MSNTGFGLLITDNHWLPDNLPCGNILVASQIYKTDASQEYVIIGNDAIIKCQYPSFVADFLNVVGWIDSEGEKFSSSINTGNHKELYVVVNCRFDMTLMCIIPFFSYSFISLLIFSCPSRLQNSSP